MFRFTIFGIPVEVQPFFWITLIILGGAGGADSKVAIFNIVLFVLAGFISILVHELGHALTARKYGANVHIVLQAFGGYAAYSGVRMDRRQSFLVTAAGPGAGLTLLFAVLAGMCAFYGAAEVSAMTGLELFGIRPDFLPIELFTLSQEKPFVFSLLMNFIWINFWWSALNLLPVIPLDGGHMLNAAMGPSRIRTTLWISIIVASGVALFMFVRNPGNFIFPIFLGMFAWQSYQALQQTRYR